MSEIEEERKGQKNYRKNRRPLPGVKKIANGTSNLDPETDQQKGDENQSKRQYTSVPVPSELIGTRAFGKISDLITRGRGKFGFIYIGLDNTRPRQEIPRIYFNYKEYVETAYPPRRGYMVEFMCKNDESGRPCATEVKLTPEGLEAAAIREEKVLSEKALKAEEAAKSSGEPASDLKDETNRKNRRIRQRKPINDKVTPLLATYEGKPEEIKTINAKLSQSIGKLKYMLITEFEAPVNCIIYCNISEENPEGEILTKYLIKKLKENDRIHFKEGIMERTKRVQDEIEA